MFVTIAAGIVALGLIGVGVWGVRSLLQASAEPPGIGTRIVAPAESKAALAAARDGMTPAERAATDYLAAQPTAYWLTPEQDPIGRAGARVLALAQEARDQDASLAIVVYGLPSRDCGNHSAGGLAEPEYERWTGEIGDALRSIPDVQKIVVVEPDSLALAPECGNIDDRERELQGAIDRLQGSDTWIYVDGGHSDWLDPSEMADLIARVGDASGIRGFATNVSNYNTSYDEFAYAHAVSDALGGWAHALVDTSRSGNGSDGQWCNPPGRAIGERGGTLGDDVVDTNLWIKPPGESDGECNGGPPAGVWWPEAAVELAGVAG